MYTLTQRTLLYSFLMIVYILCFFLLEYAELEVVFSFLLILYTLNVQSISQIDKAYALIFVLLSTVSIVANLIELAFKMRSFNPMMTGVVV